MQLTTSLLDPNRAAPLQALPASLRQQLPADYEELVAAYGTGTYCGEVIIAYPDPTSIPLTFGDLAADLWELNERFTIADLQAATQIGWSNNGDILCVVPSRPGQVAVLPRHAEIIKSWPTFWAAVASLASPADAPYYDPGYEAELEQISLVRTGQLLPIEPVWQAFVEKFKAEFVTRSTLQPCYMLAAIGGWVSFDLVYKSTITVKYQRPLAAQVAVVLSFLRQQLPY